MNIWDAGNIRCEELEDITIVIANGLLKTIYSPLVSSDIPASEMEEKENFSLITPTASCSYSGKEQTLSYPPPNHSICSMQSSKFSLTQF